MKNMGNPTDRGPHSSRRDAIVVIPTYNERSNIGIVLDEVLAAANVDVLVVDDNSPDGTGDLVAGHTGWGERVYLLSRPAKVGLGAAYRAGFAWAIARGYSQIVQMDADLSHPPARIPALLAALDQHDVAVGSRYAPGGAMTDWPLFRRIISSAGNAYVRTMLGLPVRDATAGFKAFRVEALADIGALNSRSNGYCFQIENTWQASRRGMSITELPITFSNRVDGVSKMSGAIVLEALVRVLRWRVTELVGSPRRIVRAAA
jgi:dolichol-phosphate mannosyltransferase